MKRLEATISGRVQGVFYRQTTKHKADELHVTGWVRNEADGSVRVVAEGDESALQALRAYLAVGPAAAIVTHIDEVWLVASGEFSRFAVRY